MSLTSTQSALTSPGKDGHGESEKVVGVLQGVKLTVSLPS